MGKVERSKPNSTFNPEKLRIISVKFYSYANALKVAGASLKRTRNKNRKCIDKRKLL